MRLLLVVLLTVVLAACGTEEKDDPVTQDAERTLTEQREQVRALAVEVARLLADATGGHNKVHGTWRGCVTAELDGTYGSYQYAAQGRLDVPAGTKRPYLDAVARRLEREGHTVRLDEAGNVRDLTVDTGGLTLSAREYADQQGFLTWGVSGACVEVPRDDRDFWMDREEPEPDVLADAAG